MPENFSKVHLIISAVAAAVVAAGFIVIHVYSYTHGLFLMAFWVSLAIVLFYCVGLFAQAFLASSLYPAEEKEGGDADSESKADAAEPRPEAELLPEYGEAPQGMMQAPEFFGDDEGFFEESPGEL